ncbi:penicillin-binding transpeptidase domain-containing protein [Streptomyces sp. NPDC086787]|uniref:penicillin-binding transpeptidase domain-containing protein n=1 Tax=Streptomyces sp. NPDC086787 TaxID=3365759 RepID=UPI0037F2B95C
MPNPEHSTLHRRRPRVLRRSVVAVAVVAAAATGGAYAIGLGPFARGSDGPAPEAVAQARAFLADWADGRLPSAAGRTTSPGPAQDVLKNFTAGLDIARPALTASEATTAANGTVTVPFTAKMPIAGLGTWTYTSKVPLRRQDDGTWKVAWTLSLVHPHLSATDKFRLEREEAADAPKATDRAGATLSGDEHPSLKPVLSALTTAGQGSGGAVRLVSRATGEIKGTEVTFTRKTGGPADRPVAVTIDSAWQSAAEKAVAAKSGGRDVALVALRIDNGEILAAANSPASGFNRAVSGTYAPGSTWKLVTSSALLLKNAVEPGDVVDCPKYLTVGKRFQNVETSEHRNATFLKDFTESCNTAFISLRDRLGDKELGDVARTYFGVGQEWHIGIPSYDGSVPTPRDQTEKAASMIGQGRVQANPMIMASVTATVASGTFHQPRITPGAKDTTKTKPLPSRVVRQLRDMMRATVTDGTARVLADLPGDVGAKTGTAEVSEDTPNNGWLVARRGNVAVACVVEKGVTGGSSAGPIVRGLLAAVPDDPS